MDVECYVVATQLQGMTLTPIYWSAAWLRTGVIQWLFVLLKLFLWPNISNHLYPSFQFKTDDMSMSEETGQFSSII